MWSVIRAFMIVVFLWGYMAWLAIKMTNGMMKRREIAMKDRWERKNSK